MAKKNMWSINGGIIKFMGIVTGINVKVSEILINSAIFIIKNNQIFKCFILKIPFIMIGRVNFKSLNNSLIIIYIYNAQNKNRIIVKTIYALLLI